MNQGPASIGDLAYLWALQRPDGAGIATTGHDRAVRSGGVLYDPAPSTLSLEELLVDEGLSGSRLVVGGSLSSSGITSDDMSGGRWNGSSLELSIGHWHQAEVAAKSLCRGKLQALSFNRETFESEVSITPPRMLEPPCPRTSPECRARLGDQQCRVDLRGRSRRGRVLQTKGERLQVDLAADQRFVLGSWRWLSGPNAGLEQTIMGVEEGWVTLRESPRFPVDTGTRVQLTEGCDGRLVTCADRFQNTANFRGEPHLPGTDYLTRYPGD